MEFHTPEIKAPDRVKTDEEFNLEVEIGPYPNTLGHSIRRVELYFYEEVREFNPILLATVSLTPTYVEPRIRMSLRLRKSGVVYTIGYCDYHRLLEARKRIEVES